MKKQIAVILSASLLIIVSIGVASATPVHLSTGYMPDWSPDGNSIVYGNHQIYTINIDGTDRQQITNMPSNRSAWGPEYRPGTDQIYYMDNSPYGQTIIG